MLTIHLCISGFTQNETYLHGVWKLAERLRSVSETDCKNIRISLRPWKSDWKRLAEYYWLLSEYYLKKVQVCIYAYSYGAGWGAMQMAYYLSRNGIDVRVMVLSDPVYRSPRWFLRWMSMMQRMFFITPVIHVPDNVKEVFALYQTTNVPQGHKLSADNGTTIHSNILVKHTTHQKMDDSWLFHALSLEVARRVSKNEPLGTINIDALDIENFHIA